MYGFFRFEASFYDKVKKVVDKKYFLVVEPKYVNRVLIASPKLSSGVNQNDWPLDSVRGNPEDHAIVLAVSLLT